MTDRTLPAGRISHAQQSLMANHASLVKQQVAEFCGKAVATNQ